MQTKKYLKNLAAFLRGLCLTAGWAVVPGKHVGKNVRVFLSASIEADSGASITIGKGSKIRERSVISVRKGGELILGNNVSVGMDNKIAVHERVVIGDGTLLSPNVLIYDHNHVFDFEEGVKRKDFYTKPVLIGRNCWIGANSVILSGTVIGDYCLIGAGSVVSGEIPSRSKVIQKRSNTMKGKQQAE